MPGMISKVSAEPKYLLRSNAILNYERPWVMSTNIINEQPTWLKSKILCPLAISLGKSNFRNCSFPLALRSCLCCSSGGKSNASSSGAERYGCWQTFLSYKKYQMKTMVRPMRHSSVRWERERTSIRMFLTLFARAVDAMLDNDT